MATVIRRDSDRLEPVIDPAIKVIEKLFQTGESSEEERFQAGVAKGILATWAKLKQTERAQDMMYFAMARELATDKDQLARYMELTLPGGGPLKVLESGKK